MLSSLWARAAALGIATIAVIALTAQERHPNHAKRPTAAPAPTLTAYHGPGPRGLHGETNELRAEARHGALVMRYLDAAARHSARVRATQSVVRRPRPARSRNFAPTRSSVTARSRGNTSAGGPLSTFQACVRGRESHNTYTITNSEGASGAYQFMQETWNTWARSSGHSEYVGVLPARVPPSVQDAVAAYAMARDRSPWACTKASGCRRPC